MPNGIELTMPIPVPYSDYYAGVQLCSLSLVRLLNS